MGGAPPEDPVRWRVAGGLWLALAVWPSTVGAQEASFDLSSSVRGAYWGASRSLDGEEHLGGIALWLDGRWQPTSSVAVVADGWVRNDDVFQSGSTTGHLREAYLDLRWGALDLRLGRQIIAWGRGDAVNPTDTLTSRDFTLMVPEAVDQRRGGESAVGTFYVGDTSFTGVWLPTYEPHTIPVSTPAGAPVVLTRRVPEEPVTQYAVKVDRVGRTADWSVSYFDGFDLYPDLLLEERGPATIQVAQAFHRVRVLGADFATTAGALGVRGELAYTFTEQAPDNTIKSPFYLMVLGVDRTILDGLELSPQYVLRVVDDYRNPEHVSDPVLRAIAIEQAAINSQLDRIQHSAALAVRQRWLNDTLETEVGSMLGLARRDYAVRITARYAITDHWRATAGADVFRGPSPSFFGRIREMSTAYVEIRWDL